MAKTPKSFWPFRVQWDFDLNPIALKMAKTPTLLYLEWPKLHSVLASFGRSECTQNGKTPTLFIALRMAKTP